MHFRTENTISQTILAARCTSISANSAPDSNATFTTLCYYNTTDGDYGKGNSYCQVYKPTWCAIDYLKKAWWQKFVQENPYNVGVDCAILMNPQTWVASGHLGGFSDPLMDCKECHERFRADKLIEDYCAENGITLEESVDAWSSVVC